jgi:alpha-tubulin suppressor-like RCC1 family protein
MPSHTAKVCTPLLLAGLLALPACQDDVTAPSTSDPDASLAVVAAPLPFRQISAGGFHSCGVTTGDRAYCWGMNHSGQLGDGTTTDRSRPVAVDGGLRFRMVSAGTFHTCGVTTDSRAYCWGANDNGTLGDGTTTARFTPVAVAGGRLFRQVRAGNLHTCGVTPSDEAFCWGNNRYGQLGDGSDFNRRLRPVPVAGGLRFRQVTAGSLHTCGATTNDRGFCWGSGLGGEIGDGKTFQRRTPRAVAGGISFRQVHAGEDFRSCGVSRQDQAYCWGDNSGGQLGDGTTTRRLTPVLVAGGHRFSGVSPGTTHTCGTTTTGVAKCWGENDVGQLGDGTRTRRLRPVTVAGNLRFAPGAVAAGGSGRHTCGVTTGNRAYCWGGNFRSQLGDGTNTDRLTPVPVAGPSQ